MDKLKRKKFERAFLAAFRYTIPILAGFLVLGMAYGVLMQTKGYGAQWAVLMSAIAFCGSMQFVAITILTTAFDPLQAFLLSFMVNARHLFYGIAMLEKYKGLGKVRGFLIYTLCDETFSINSSTVPPAEIEKKYFYLAISLQNYLYWVLGTLMGCVLGKFITFDTKGLDFALTALFFVLFLEQMRKRENRIYGLIGLVATVIGLCTFGAANLVIPSMIFILIILLVRRTRVCC